MASASGHDDKADVADGDSCVKKWAESVDSLLHDDAGIQALRGYLKSEKNEENLNFWEKVQGYKKIFNQEDGEVDETRALVLAAQISAVHIRVSAPEQVNISSKARRAILGNLGIVNEHLFDQAEEEIHQVIKKDPYPRFLKSKCYKALVKVQEEQQAACSHEKSLAHSSQHAQPLDQKKESILLKHPEVQYVAYKRDSTQATPNKQFSFFLHHPMQAIMGGHGARAIQKPKRQLISSKAFPAMKSGLQAAKEKIRKLISGTGQKFKKGSVIQQPRKAEPPSRRASKRIAPSGGPFYASLEDIPKALTTINQPLNRRKASSIGNFLEEPAEASLLEDITTALNIQHQQLLIRKTSSIGNLLDEPSGSGLEAVPSSINIHQSLRRKASSIGNLLNETNEPGEHHSLHPLTVQWIISQRSASAALPEVDGYFGFLEEFDG